MTLTRHMARQDLRDYFHEETLYGVEDFVELWFSNTTQETLYGLVEKLKKK